MGLGTISLDLDLVVIVGLSLIVIFMIFVLPAFIMGQREKEIREKFQRHFGFDPLSLTAKREEFVVSRFKELRDEWWSNEIPIPEPKIERGFSTLDSLGNMIDYFADKNKIMSNLNSYQKASEQRKQNVLEAEEVAEYFGFNLK